MLQIHTSTVLWLLLMAVAAPNLFFSLVILKAVLKVDPHKAARSAASSPDTLTADSLPLPSLDS